MAWTPQNFVNNVGPVIGATWLNSIDQFWGSFFGAPLSQSALIQTIGSWFNPTTTQETAAGVVPTNFLYPTLNVLRYGADPTGAADSTVAFNNAIAVTQQYTSAPPFGTTVSIPRGAFLVNSGTPKVVTINQASFTMQGVGGNSSFIINGTAALPAFDFGNSASGLVNRIWVKDLCFGQASGVPALVPNCAIRMQNISQGGILNVLIFNFPGAPYQGVTLFNCSQFTYENVQIQGCLNTGLSASTMTDWYATDCRSDGNASSGVFFDYVQGANFKSFTCFNNNVYGWQLASTSPVTHPNFNNVFYNCVGDTSGNHDWNIADSGTSVWVACWGSAQQSHSVNPNACGFFISTVNSHHLTFTGCQAHFNNAHGFSVFDSGSAAPTNINFVGCMAGAVGPTGAVGNGQGAGGGYGLFANAGVSHLRINGGNYTNNITGQINLTLTGTFAAQDVVVSGNPIGFVSSSSGLSSIINGTSTITVSHGLSYTPDASQLFITGISNLTVAGGHTFWVTNVTATQFTVNVDATLTAGWSFGWNIKFFGS